MPLPRPAPGTGRWWVVGVVGCTVAVALATWLALANTLGQVTWDVTGYKVVDDATVTVDFDVHRPSHTAVTCRVTALDSRFGTVGTLDVPVPGSTQGSVHERVTVRTTSRAVTGTVKACTPADQ